MRDPKGHDTFRQLLVYFDTQRVVIPTYRTLQDLFTHALAKENERLSRLISLIPQQRQAELSELIALEDGITKLSLK